MHSRATSLQAWRSVRQRLPTGTQLTIARDAGFPHPRDAGARATVSWPVGQIADWALELELGAPPLIIREFANRFEVTVAGVELARQIIALAEANPAAAMCLGGAMLGAAVGAAVTRRHEGTVLGAGLGLVFAALINAYVSERSQS
jgi:hypothetical protein